MVSNLYEFAEFLGKISHKDGLNDQKWSKEIFQKGLIYFFGMIQKSSRCQII